MCADLWNLQKDLEVLVEHAVEYFHIDIMDGHYVQTSRWELGFAGRFVPAPTRSWTFTS
jgi:pentose-5-phosphate-3-epimerase